MAINSDVLVDPVNKIIKREAAAGSTVYTVNSLYSFLEDQFDDLSGTEGNITNKVSMSVQTPTAYTMINGWYLQEELTNYLAEGAVQTSGYTDEIRTLHCGSAGWTNFVAADIGKVLTGGTTGDTGTVLDYDNAAYKIWIRMDAAGDTFDNAAETYVTTAGTGAGTSTAISTTGEHLFANFYTLGSLNTSNGAPQLYIYQDGEPLANSSWFGTGHVDVLVKVSESGVDIDGKAITVYGRNWGDLYTNFPITLTAAGQNAVPLATSNDSSITLAEAASEALADTDIGGSAGTGVNITVDFGAYSYDIGDGNGAQTYDVQVDCNSLPLASVYHVCQWATAAGRLTDLTTGIDGQEYTAADQGEATPTYSANAPTPFGSYGGGSFAGARGVYFINLHGDDAQAFRLIDAAGVERTPPNYQAFTVAGVLDGDTVLVAEAVGSAGADATLIANDQYTSHSSSNAAATTSYVVQEAIPVDTPASGTIILVNTGTGGEESIAYTSWSTSTFTLASAHSGGYAGDDTAYVPYIYELSAAAGSVSETSTIFAENRDLVTRVRKAGYKHFESPGTYTATGYTATAIRAVEPNYTA